MEKKFYNLTNPQKNIWNMEQYYKGTAVNNIGGTVHLKTQLDFSALSKAVSNVILAHDNFHIKLTKDGNNIKQIFVSLENYFVEIIDLNDMAELLLIEEKMCQTTFSMENSNLFCVKIFRLPNGTGGVISVMHHIISDSWTVGLFCKEIVQEYTNLIKNTKSDDVEYSYINYIKKEQEYLNSPRFEKDKKYWAEVFNTVPELATIPCFSAESSNQVSCTAKRQKFAISKQVMDKVSEFCKNNRISIYNFFMSIFSIYIGRVSNLDDFVIGTPILNRLDFADKNTNGMFISTVPLRVNILNDSSFVDFSKSMARSCLSMLRHQRYPYQNILEDLRKLDSSIPNLYNVVLSYQITNTVNDEIDCDSHWVFNGTCADDLQIHMVDYNSTGLNVFYDYKTSKYDVNDINNLHNRIENMIHQVLSNNEINVSAIEIVTPEEKKQILNDFNNTKFEYSKNKAVIDLFEEQVIKHSNYTALVFEDTSLTYKELYERANLLANCLSDKGIKKGSVVGIFLDKCLESIISILAILKNDAVFLPIDVNYPLERISFMINDSSCELVLSKAPYIDNISDISTVLDVESINSSNNHLKRSPLNSLKQPAYIMYTSGSTGKPKGVVVNNQNIIRLVTHPNYIDFRDDDRILQTGSIVFDACTFEIWGALLNGLPLYLIKQEDLLNACSLKNFINRHHITILWLTNPLFNKLCEDDATIFENVRCLLTGGDVLYPKYINKVRNTNPSLQVINGYGPTENTTFSCCFHIKKNYETSIPIGSPITNSTCYIVNPNTGTLQPIGVPGELWVGGDGVSNGYLNRDKLNNEKFIDNYFNDRIYKTGDLVEWLPDGTISFIGRIDNQVKIRGFRVELSEVNSKILEIPNIKESFSTIFDDSGTKYICSYVISDSEIDSSNIKNQLKEILPSYMVPSFIMQIDKLPLNANGKVDKKLLPAPSISHTKNIVAPRNNIDINVIKIFKSVFRIDSEISMDDTFLDLGGDSLSAISIISAVRQEFNVTLPIINLINNASLKSISDFISNNISHTSNTAKIKEAPVSEYYPLSSAQKRIYYACKLAGNNSLIYNIPGAILVDSMLNKEKVVSAFRSIIKSQSVFRTIFVIEDEEVKQKILENVDFVVESFNNTSSEVDSLVNNFAKPFDLENAPLLRVEIHYIDNNQTLLLFDSHHIIMDGVSLEILIKNFFSIYNDFPMSKSPIEYKDYAVYEKEFLNSDDIKKSEKYWLTRFKNYDFESLNLPYDYTIPANRGYIGNKIYNTIDSNLFNRVNNFAKEIQISPYSVFLASLFITLYKYTGQPDIVIGSPVANRTIPETRDIIGMFVNNIAIRAKVPTNKTIYTFLQKIMKIVMEDLEHQSYPYDLLVKKLQIPMDNSKNPLFDIVLTYQSQQENIDYKILPINTNTAKFNIVLEIEPQTNNINIEYRTDIFKEETIRSFVNHYLFVLEQLLNNPNSKIDDVNIVTPKEQMLLNSFNDTNEPINRAPVSKIFEEQAVLHANDVAVICDDRFLTYKELNERANSLAHYLISKGVKPNDIIAIMTNRSLETIVCMLGILKAGAAFLNVDPTYPIDRTEYYINDSKIERVLTQKELREKVAQIKNSIEIDLDNTEIYGKHTSNPNVSVKETDLSYIIYTSGSTGTPKGVMLNQIGMSNMVQAMTKVLDYLKEGNKHAIASVTSTPFDIFVYEIIVSLTHGLKVVMANNAEHRNPKLLDALIKKYNVDVMTVTPSLMKINYDNREPDTALARVKNMVFGGEPLPEKFVQDLRALADDITIYNIYGPSEITILSNVQNLNGEKEITIGPPILNTQIYILDKNMKQVPIGVIGEIYIGGIQVGDGYIGKAELTAERFLKNPFGSGKIYKSGDIGRWTFDGKVQCLGRIDNQVKLRGLRIELSEIENEILKINGVTSAIVNKIVLDNQEFLCAYYVADTNIGETTVKDTLRKFLPQYMVPTYVMKLETMPYTINRKIDRKALPLPETHKMVTSSHVNIAKLDSNEEKLLQIWKNLLKIDTIDVNDNFFDIGGDSILAINMQIEALKYGLEIEYADIFNFPTVRQLSKKLPSPEESFMCEYNYSKINKILALNNTDNLDKIEKYEVKNILLIGATGYLGAHILNSFLHNESGIAYCLIRDKNGISSEERLFNRLHFYFGNSIEKFKNRIKIISGDIVKENIGLSDSDYNELINGINVVINSGALVKHFGLKKLFEDINVTGTKNIVNFCLHNAKRLIHCSTISVSGFGDKNEFTITPNADESRDFSEQDLFINQDLKGIYGITKYKAEMIVLEAIENGLDAQILRIGNLTNRYSDGMFQINVDENAFAKRIQSFVEIGAFPKYLLQHAIELTPVDLCAESIIRILEYSSNCNVFHIYNPNLVSIRMLYNTLVENGFDIIPVSNKMMNYILSGILEDDNEKSVVSGIVQDIDSNKQFTYISKIHLQSNFTVHFLEKIGFIWPIYDSSYIDKTLKYFEKINFLNRTMED